MKNLRHTSLDWNVFFMSVKFYYWEMSIKRDVLAQKTKVKKSVFISQFFQFTGDLLLLSDTE